MAYLCTWGPRTGTAQLPNSRMAFGPLVVLPGFDGGIGPSTISGAAAAGANVFIAGSALFRDPLGQAHAVDEIRSLAEQARG